MFGVLTDGQRHAPVDARLCWPKRWIEDPVRCERAWIAAHARTLTPKSGHALDIMRQARARGMPVALVTLGQRAVVRQPGMKLLSPRDMVDMLKETLPRKPEG